MDLEQIEPKWLRSICKHEIRGTTKVFSISSFRGFASGETFASPRLLANVTGMSGVLMLLLNPAQLWPASRPQFALV